MSAVVRIVDDQEEVRRLLRLMIERVGHSVVPDVEPSRLMDEDAWTSVTHAIVDLHLDGWPSDGVDVLRWLASHRPDIVRILSSAHMDTDILVIEAEATDLAHFVIHKPLSLHTLKLLLDSGVPDD